MWAAQHPAAKHWSFREIFAGKGHLSRTFRSRGIFRVDAPVEILQHGVETPEHDILVDETFGRLCADACRPRQVWHFGFPCGSFSLMQNMNKGTRSAENPVGDGSLERERIGNEILSRTIHLCRLLHKHGSFFTLENPLTSYAWKMPNLFSLVMDTKCTEAVLDQCQYGLRLPDNRGVAGLAQKPTRFAGTLPGLEKLSKRCPHDHTHVQVIGKVKIAGTWHKRSTRAGAYPPQLCSQYAKILEAGFA